MGKRAVVAIITFMILAVVGAVVWSVVRPSRPDGQGEDLTASISMRLESPAFGQNEAIPFVYTCDGEDKLPPLSVLKVPEDAVSLAFIVDDPDAPAGSFTHWTIWNVPSTVATVAEGVSPPGVEGRTDFGRTGWVGPCPPSGEHRYFFKVYALDAELDLPLGASVSELEAAMSGHVIDKAGLVGVYERRR